MLTIRSCAAALALAVVGLAVQAPAHACDERVAGSCKPVAPLDAAHVEVAARTETAKGQAGKSQTAKGEAVAAASETRRSRRSARRASARQRWSHKRIRFSQRSKSHRQNRAERRANRRYALGKRTRRDRIEMDGRASPMELDEAMASTTAASTVGPMLQGAPTLEPQFAPRSGTPVVATPAMKFADVGVGVPVLAQDGSSTTPPANATAALEAAKQRFVAAGLAHKQEAQAAPRVVTTAPEPPSDSATLRLTLVALAGLLALGTVVRLVIG